LIVFPAQGLIALTILVGIVFLLTGIAQSFYAFWVRPANGWGWILASTVILWVLFGIDFVSTGMSMVLIAMSVRREE